MKRSNKAIFTYIIMLGAILSLSACEGIFESIYDQPKETVTEIKAGSFSQINATSYTTWVYIKLNKLEATTVEIAEGEEANIPEDWDFAIHRYDIKTNEGAVLQTSYTNFDDLQSFGKVPAGEFSEDVWTTDKVAIDMTGMMDDNIIYTDSYRNAVFSGWLNVDTSTMPPIYTMTKNIYLIRLKDGSYAAVRFTNYMDAKSIKGYISFDYVSPITLSEDEGEASDKSIRDGHTQNASRSSRLR